MDGPPAEQVHKAAGPLDVAKAASSQNGTVGNVVLVKHADTFRLFSP